MGKRLIWIGACALAGLLVAFAGLSSASAGQNTNNANGGNANGGNANHSHRHGNANAGGMNGNDAGMNSNAGGGSAVNANTGLASSDRKFVMEAAMGGMAEVEMGRLGVERATSDDVKMFSQRLIDDHTKANAELTQLAGTKGVTLPTALDAKHQAMVERLRALSGAAFEREFAKAGVKDHRKDIGEFQKEADRGRDADIKSFASRTLPTLQEHLRMAEEAQTRLKGTTGASAGGGMNANAGGMNANAGGGMNANAGSNMNANTGGNSNRGGRNRNSNRNANSNMNSNMNGNANAGGNTNNSNNGNRR